VAVGSIFRFYAFYYQLDGLKGVMIGTMRGLGLLKNTTTIVFIARYIVAPPFEYLFGFTLGFKIPGLWSGMFIG
jgi:Na+-driven multidrug efflux pump